MAVYLYLPDFRVLDVVLKPSDTPDALCELNGYPGAVLELFGRELDPQTLIGAQDVCAGDMLIMRERKRRGYVFHWCERRISVQALDFEEARKELASELQLSLARILLTDMQNVAFAGPPQGCEFKVFEKPATDILVEFPQLGTSRIFRADATAVDVRQALALDVSYTLACRARILGDNQALSSVIAEKGALEIIWEGAGAATEITHF